MVNLPKIHETISSKSMKSKKKTMQNFSGTSNSQENP